MTQLGRPNPAAAASFRLIQLALLPLGTVGYLWALPRLLVYSHRTAVSATLLASLYSRYMQHRLGTRADGPAARLMLVMPNVSRIGFGLVAVPTAVAHRLTGYVPRIYRYPYEGQPPLSHQEAARTSFYDAALVRHLPGIDQLVILGAGFDTRAYRLPAAGRPRCFELDKPRTQAFKLSMLQRAGLPARTASYVAADLREDGWYDRLEAAGFDPRRRSFFLWEAVTMYLDRPAVEETLRRIAGTAPGSVVAFDYFSGRTLASRSPYMRFARATTALRANPSASASTPRPRPGSASLNSSGPSAWRWRSTGTSAGNPEGAGRRRGSSPPSSAGRRNDPRPAGVNLPTVFPSPGYHPPEMRLQYSGCKLEGAP